MTSRDADSASGADRSGDPAFSPPDQDRSPNDIADEQFVHGALEFLHNDTAAAQSDRIERVMASIDGREAHQPTSRRIPPLWIIASTIAAAIVIAIWLARPQDDAAAELELQQAAEARQGLGDRRYAFRAYFAADASGREEPATGPLATGPLATGPLATELLGIEGTFDIRDHQHALIRFHTANKQRVIAGRNETGEWMLHTNRVVHGSLTDNSWPQWLSIDENVTLLEPSIEHIHRVLERYRVQHHGRVHLAGHGEESFTHILGEHDANDATKPDTMALWLDHSHRVHKMVLHWHSASIHGHDDHAHGDHGHDDHGHDAGHDTEQVHQPDTGHRDGGHETHDPVHDAIHELASMHDLHQALVKLTQIAAGHFVPPKRIVFELVDQSAFPADWFEAKTHTKKR